jgi:DNA-binding IscR family transcriptional regulator
MQAQSRWLELLDARAQLDAAYCDEDRCVARQVVAEAEESYENATRSSLLADAACGDE